MTILSPDTGSPDTGSPESGVTDGVLSDAGAMGTRTGAADLDPLITGPMPAVDLLDGHLHVVRAARGRPSSPSTAASTTPSPSWSRPRSRSPSPAVDAVILDLDRVTLLDRSALERICATIDVGTLDAEPVRGRGAAVRAGWSSTAGTSPSRSPCSTASPTPSRPARSSRAATATGGERRG